MERILEYLITMPRSFKRVFIYCIDVILITCAYIASVSLINNNLLDGLFSIASYHFSATLLLTITALLALGFYHTVTRFVSFKILVTISIGAVVAGFFFFVLGDVFELAFPYQSSSIIYSALLCILLGGSRLLVRSYFSMRFNTQKEKVLIYGAGSAGRQLALSLISGKEYYPVGFVDDDLSLANVFIQGIKVYHSTQLAEAVSRLNPEKVLLALPSLNRTERKAIIGRIEEVGIGVQTIPGMADIIEGRMKIDEFQDVEIDDLLGRDPVPPIEHLLLENINGKVVMVTGAGGSIGSELCRQILELNPKELLLFDISEYSLYAIDKELNDLCVEKNLNVAIKAFLGSVQDKNLVSSILNRFKVDSLYHAAAYKHVPLVEYNIIEGIRNNVFGTLNTALAAIEAKVSTFVLISTDKAVRPTNFMGASKRFSELVLQGLSFKQKTTRFCMVRFGNVLGSSGSVVPLFKKQIKQGGPVTVTHPDITRFFMTIPEAAQLVIQAGAMGKGGDVFVLDMGEPVKITELAKKLIILMGMELKDESHPSGDIEIVNSGLRPGEKLYEELLIGEDIEGTNHPRIMTAQEKALSWPEVELFLKKLEAACSQYDHSEIMNILKSAPTDFSPKDAISDYLSDIKASNADNIINLKG